MKKKIGVLTFHQSSNYGAIMQAYALNKALNSLGADCETIDYHCKAIFDANFTRFTTCKDVLRNIYKAWKAYQCRRFVKNNIRLSRRFDERSIQSSQYDAYIVGSDQVWNPRCTGNDKAYFIDFVLDKKKKYSYAASVGLKWEDAIAVMESYKELLNDFTFVSLREHINDDRITEMLSTNVRYDIDPVFLLSKNEWKDICGKRCIGDKYIFVYLIGNPVHLEAFVQKLKEATGYKVISNKKSGGFMCHCRPQDFLSWIYNAEYIVTNSFHGTALSVIFQKEFYVECKGEAGYNYRVDGLLKLLGLTDRAIERNSLIDLNKKIKYEAVNKVTKAKKERAVEYLKAIIKN